MGLLKVVISINIWFWVEFKCMSDYKLSHNKNLYDT